MAGSRIILRVALMGGEASRRGAERYKDLVISVVSYLKNFATPYTPVHDVADQ